MKGFIRLKTLCLAALAFSAAVLIFAEPAWWSTRGVVNHAKEPDDYAVLNQGQLKNLARAARDEMNDKLPGGAGTAIDTLVAAWTQNTAHADDFGAVNVGQLKNVARVFYDRLIAARVVTSYPWPPSAPGAEDYRIANIGQAKSLFGFTVFEDSDGDGMDDRWEMFNFGSLARDGRLDTDGDGLTDLQEYLAGLNPNLWSSNGNDIADGAVGQGTVGLWVFSPLVTR